MNNIKHTPGYLPSLADVKEIAQRLGILSGKNRLKIFSPNLFSITSGFIFVLFHIGIAFISLLVFMLVIHNHYVDSNGAIPVFNYPEIQLVQEGQLDPLPEGMAAVSDSDEEEDYSNSTEENTASGLLEEESIEIAEPPEITPYPTPITPVVTNLEFTSSEMCTPISGIDFSELESIISQPFNVPNPYSDQGHHGVDFGSYNYGGYNLLGWPIQAVFPGKVAGTVVNKPPLGNTIIIESTTEDLPEHLVRVLGIEPNQSLYHLYSHMMDEPTLEIGTLIECGEVIGNLGKSQTAEAHLHFETRIGESGLIIESMAFYDTSATDRERETYMWWRTSGIVMPFDPMNLFVNIGN